MMEMRRRHLRIGLRAGLGVLNDALVGDSARSAPGVSAPALPNRSPARKRRKRPSAPTSIAIVERHCRRPWQQGSEPVPARLAQMVAWSKGERSQPALATRLDHRGSSKCPAESTVKASSWRQVLLDARARAPARCERTAWLPRARASCTVVVQVRSYVLTGNISARAPTCRIPRDRKRQRRCLAPTTSTRLVRRDRDGDIRSIYPGVSTVVRTPEDAACVVNEQVASGVEHHQGIHKNFGARRHQGEDNLRRARTGRGRARGRRQGLSTVWAALPRAIDGRAEALQPRTRRPGVDVIAHSEEVFFTALYASIERQLDQGVGAGGDGRCR